MTLEQLHYFFEVYQYRSINSASARLNISQQSLSSAIRNLENEFSTKFFERNYRGVHPTPAGDRFFQTVQNILKEIHDFNMYLTPPPRKILPNVTLVFFMLFLTPAVNYILY